MKQQLVTALLSLAMGVSLFGVMPAPKVLATGTVYAWNCGTSGAWTTTTCWSPTRTTPATTDIMQFTTGGSVTVSSVPIETIAQLLVSSSTTVNLQPNSTVITLTISGDTGTDLDVASGSALNMTTSANYALQLSLGASATGSISGSMSCAGGTGNATHKLLATTASSVTFNSGATFTQDTKCMDNAFGDTGTANVIVFASGSTFISKSGANPFGLTQPSSKVIFQSGSLYRHEQSGVPAFNGRTYADFELNISGAISPTGSNAVSMDNLTITSGTLNFNVTGTPGHSIKGDISVASGQTLTFSPSSTGTVNLNGASAQTISGGGTISSTANSTLVIGNAAGVIISNDVTIGGGLAQAGDLTVSSGKTLTLSSTDVSYTSGTVTNNGTLSQSKTVSSGTVTFLGFGTAYYGVSIADPSPSLDSTTVKVAGNQECSNIHSGSDPVLRCYTLTPTSSGTTTVRFYYRYAELRSGQNPANLKVWKYSSGTTWTEVTGVTYNRSACSSGEGCYVEVQGYSLSSGTFLLMEHDPTAAILAAFGAGASWSGIMVTWETASELGNLGFNLYRATAEGGPWARVNPAVIQSRSPGSPEGFRYAWLDRPPARGTYWYRLAGVGYDGRETLLDTVSVQSAYGWLWLPWVGGR